MMMEETVSKKYRFSLEKTNGKFELKKFLLQWEMILLYIFIVFNALLYVLNGKVFTNSYTSIIQAGLDLSFMIFPMIFILLLGDIDVSVGATLALSGMVLGLVYEATGNTVLSIGACLLTGATAGFINGMLIASFKEISAVIVTISMMLFYRGIVKVVLDVRSLTQFPTWFGDLGYTNYLGVPISLWAFIVVAIIFGLILHKTSFGRKLYAIGNNKEGAYFAGIKVNQVKVIVFTLMGLMAAVSSIFYLGRSPSVVANIGEGYELKVIAICVLGGVSTSGGKGKALGPIIGVFIMVFLDKLLGYNGVQPAARIMSVGVLLVVALLAEKIKFKQVVKKD